MRKVKFTKWHDGSGRTIKIYTEKETITGKFHQWGTTAAYTDDTGGYFPVSVGIVEDESGKIYLADPSSMIFIDPSSIPV